MGYDQWMLMYDHYCVMGAKITVKVAYQNDTDTAYPVTVCLVKQASTSTTSIAASVMEQPQTKWTTLSTTRKEAQISHRWSARKSWGAKNPQAIDRVVGTSGSNPLDQYYFGIVVFPTDQIATVDLPPLIIQINLSYRARLSEVKFLSGS